MAVGINAVRAICTRVPSVLSLETEEGNSVALDMEAFARDLAAHSKHRDRSVMIAGKPGLNFIRQVHPGLLQGKDRGLAGSSLHRAGTKPLRYGQTKVASGVEGADLLVAYESRKAAKKKKGEEDNESSDGDDEGEAEEPMNDEEFEDEDVEEEEENEDDDEEEDDNNDEEEDDDDKENDDEDGWIDVEEGDSDVFEVDSDDEPDEAPKLVLLGADGKPVDDDGVLDIPKRLKKSAID
jgi:hypothetical protein